MLSPAVRSTNPCSLTALFSTSRIMMRRRVSEAENKSLCNADADGPCHRIAKIRARHQGDEKAHNLRQRSGMATKKSPESSDQDLLLRRHSDSIIRKSG